MEEKLNPVEKVYSAFYESKKKSMYFNEIKDKTNMSISSLQNALLKLKRLKYIIETKEKGNTFYSLRLNETKILIFTKLDIQRLNLLNQNVKVPLKEFLSEIENVSFVLLFGSSSRKQEKEESDIDILVVLQKFDNRSLNELYEKEIIGNVEELRKKINSRSIHPLNPIFVDEEEFKNKKDYLLEQARNTGFCIYNHETYYQRLSKNED